MSSLKDKLQPLLDIIEDADRITEGMRLSGGYGDIYNAYKYVKAQKFDELVKYLRQLDNIMTSGVEYSDDEYTSIIAEAQKKLDELPFGSAEWQRQYGFIEGLKQIKFYTKTNNAIQY